MNFLDAARLHFDPIALRHGMTCVEARKGHIKYAKSACSFSVDHEWNRGGDLFVDVAGADGSPTFDLSLLVKFAARPDEDQRRLAVYEETAIEPFIALLAKRLERFGDDCLKGDPAAFARLAHFARSENEAYRLDTELRLARGESDRAWQAKNYQAIVASLQPLEAHLSKAEHARLRFARKKSMA